MSSREVERTARLSVLDRLIDDDMRRSADPTPTWEESVAAYRAAVLRDVEWLLNSRRVGDPAPDAYPEVHRSLYNYGLPDITSLSAESESSRRRLLRSIEETLQLFEPRLMSIRVVPVEVTTEGKRHIRFSIEALLKMEPNPERVVFDTVLEATSGRFVVSGA